MTDEHNREIERVLFVISDAQERARRVGERIEKDGAEAHLVSALREAEAELSELHRTLMQATYYAVPDSAEQLAI